MKILKKIKIKAETKNVHSFMLELPIGKAMLYTGKKGNRLHILSTKEQFQLGYYYWDIKNHLGYCYIVKKIFRNLRGL
jgi:hypothetical protein